MDVKGTARDYLRGAAHCLAITNCYSGRESLGEKLSDLAIGRDGYFEHGLAATAGFFSGLAVEAGVIAYALIDIENRWPIVAASAAVKTIPRGMDYIARKIIPR